MPAARVNYIVVKDSPFICDDIGISPAIKDQTTYGRHSFIDITMQLNTAPYNLYTD